MVSLRAGVEHDLERLPDWLAESALGVSALSIAERLDADPAPTAASMLHRELRETLAEIRELAPPERRVDEIDELAAQREHRRAVARAAAAEDLPLPG